MRPSGQHMRLSADPGGLHHVAGWHKRSDNLKQACCTLSSANTHRYYGVLDAATATFDECVSAQVGTADPVRMPDRGSGIIACG
jgi:hypothetical protein